MRLLAGVGAACLVALAAERARALSRSGAMAAAFVGAAATSESWALGAFLLLYFVSATLVSRVGRAAKAARTSAIVEKTGARDATQVFANGAVFSLCALAVNVLDNQLFLMAAIGSLVASAADSWATETGTLWRGAPRNILTLRKVPPGMSGGVSVAGFAGLIAASAILAGGAVLLGLTNNWRAPIAAGIAGAIADSVVGALIQERRWCDGCGTPTERRVHSCGSHTRLAGGHRWINNDAVNLVATAVGAGVAVLVARA